MLTDIFTPRQKAQFNGQIEQEVIASGYSSEFGKLVAAQANLESGGYSNVAFTQYNNIAGYKYYEPNGTKYQNGRGNLANDGGYYANYNTIEDSVDELIQWFENRQAKGFFTISDIHTPKDYVNALIADPEHQWFTNGKYPPTQSQINDYIYGMSNLLQKIQFLYEENADAVNIGGGLIAIGVLVFIYAKYNKQI